MPSSKLLSFINQNSIIAQTSPIFTAAIRASLFLWAISIAFKNAIYQASVILLLSMFLAHILSHYKLAKSTIKSLFNKLKNLAILFVIVIFFMLLSAVINHDISAQTSYKMILYFIIRFGLVFASLSYFFRLGAFRAKELLFFILAGLVLLAFTGLYQLIYIIIFDAPFWEQYGISFGLSGSLGSRTGFGILVGIGLVLSVGLFFESRFASSVATKRPLLAIFQLALILLFAFCVLFSMARSSWVAFCGAILIFLAINCKKLRPKDLLLMGLLVLVSALFLALSESLQARLNELLVGESSHRIEIWAWTIEKVLSSPFLGHGPKSFELLNATLNVPLRISSPHNLTLNLLFDLGIIGTLAFYTLLIMPFIAAFKHKKLAILAALIYIFIVSHFDATIGSKDLYSYIVALSFIAFSKQIKSDIKGVK